MSNETELWHNTEKKLRKLQARDGRHCEEIKVLKARIAELEHSKRCMEQPGLGT